MKGRHIKGYCRFVCPRLALGVMLAMLTSCVALPTDSAQRPMNAIPYGAESRQWLMLYAPESDTPSAMPVYLWSHSNTGFADQPVSSMVKMLNEQGIAVISWASVPRITKLSDLETAWADAERVWRWIEEHAEMHNLDAQRVIIGGRSRGSGVSWKLAHSNKPGILGVYMDAALPDGFWQRPDVWQPVNDITLNSPPLFLAYGPVPGDGDIHRPENGMKVGDRYTELGIEDRFTLVHSLGISENTNTYQFLVDFVASLFDQSVEGFGTRSETQ